MSIIDSLGNRGGVLPTLAEKRLSPVRSAGGWTPASTHLVRRSAARKALAARMLDARRHQIRTTAVRSPEMNEGCLIDDVALPARAGDTRASTPRWTMP